MSCREQIVRVSEESAPCSRRFYEITCLGEQSPTNSLPLPFCSTDDLCITTFLDQKSSKQVSGFEKSCEYIAVRYMRSTEAARGLVPPLDNFSDKTLIYLSR